MLKDKNIELYVKSEEKGYIYADRSLLLNLLQVLLSVALLNSEADKKIKLTIKKDNEKILVIISYEGRPFSISECENLFTEKSCLTTVGLGIKMYFCKKIVEIHGGTIQAQTYGENINMFTFKLPISKNKKTLKTIDLCALKRCSI